MPQDLPRDTARSLAKPDIQVHPKVLDLLRPIAQAEAQTIRRMRRRDQVQQSSVEDDLFDNIPV